MARGPTFRLIIVVVIIDTFAGALVAILAVVAATRHAPDIWHYRMKGVSVMRCLGAEETGGDYGNAAVLFLGGRRESKVEASVLLQNEGDRRGRWSDGAREHIGEATEQLK